MLNNNSTVCFFGDSITANGHWIKMLWENMRGTTQRLFNCGVPGDKASGALARIFDTCLCYAPDYVIIMFGMNDINRQLYKMDGTEQLRENEIKNYETNLCRIIEIIKECGAVPVLMTPTPYDEVSESDEENLHCNIGIISCAEIVRRTAKNYGTGLIDCHTIFTEALKRSEPVIANDRVHPNENGHVIMAQKVAEYFGFTLKNLPISEQNEERFKVEQALSDYRYVKHCLLFEKFGDNDTSRENICAALAQIIAAGESGDYICGACRFYLDNEDRIDTYKQKLIKLTLMGSAAYRCADK